MQTPLMALVLAAATITAILVVIGLERMALLAGAASIILVFLGKVGKA